MAEGLGRLFSTQLELAEAEMQSRLLKDAEVKALQAQVHPHFLFNAINTISALCRTDPDKARELLIQLGVFFRSNLQGARQILIPLSQELRHVEAYLTLEKARFPDKFEMTFDIEPELADLEIPPFTLQPLVENAVRHAFHGLGPQHKGSVCIAASQKGHEVMIVTADNGKGIPAELLEQLGEQAVHSEDGTGTALHNIRKRIAEIYGRGKCMLKGFIVDDEPLARDELAYLLGRTRQVHIVGEADSLETALQSIAEMEPDVVFLDIQLAEDNGMELAKQLSVLEQVPDIVFATAYDEYALQAFEVNALDYILKPFEEERVRKTVDKVMKLRSAREKRAAPSPPLGPDRTGKLAVSAEERILLIDIDKHRLRGIR
uniref:Predicted protein n=1 Tax=Physcomitrium patens TaxID=3218 RepID=A9U7N0_PHYPA